MIHVMALAKNPPRIDSWWRNPEVPVSIVSATYLTRHTPFLHLSYSILTIGIFKCEGPFKYYASTAISQCVLAPHFHFASIYLNFTDVFIASPLALEI